MWHLTQFFRKYFLISHIQLEKILHLKINLLFLFSYSLFFPEYALRKLERCLFLLEIAKFHLEIKRKKYTQNISNLKLVSVFIKRKSFSLNATKSGNILILTFGVSRKHDIVMCEYAMRVFLILIKKISLSFDIESHSGS